LILHDFPANDYALGDTLSSGQAFRWRQTEGGWEGVVGARWVHLRPIPGGIRAELAEPVPDWQWLSDYLQIEVDFECIVRSFPKDPHMIKAVESSRGLRLLRQDPWECLASFILSSTKQIVQIQQIVDLVCRRFGERVSVPPERRTTSRATGSPKASGCSTGEISAGGSKSRACDSDRRSLEC